MKTAATVAIVMVALVIAGVGVYGALNMNSMIQSKPNPVQITNYSAAINSLKPQISSINNDISSMNTNMSSLGAVKSDIADIRGKLSAIETKINQAQQVSTSVQPVILVDKSAYFPGDTIHVTATGVDPQTVVHLQLVDNSGLVVMKRDASSDYAGRVTYDFPLSFTLVPGNFEVRLIVGQQSDSIPVTIMSSGYTGGVTLSGLSYLFTAQTDKTVYLPGDTIEVFGLAQPGTTVSGTLTSPSGSTLSSSVTAQADGSYALFYADSVAFETGSWHVTVHNQGLTRIVYLTVSSSFPPYAFTVQSFKSVYQPGDLVRLSGLAQPFSNVNAVLTSPSGLTYDATTTASSDGSYLLSYFTAQWYETGNWIITVTNQGQTREVSIFMETGSPSIGSDTFTAQTDKAIYKKGEMIQISGTAQPFSSVSAVLTSPSGFIYNGAALANFDGSYNIAYSTSSSFETGNWHITLHNEGLAQVVSIFLAPV